MYNGPDGKKGDKIDGVSCSVVNCEYHSPKNICHAHGIKVGTEYAGSMDETFCATFRKKST